MERTNIIVWLNKNKYWNRVYKADGKLYVKTGPGKADYTLLDNCHIRKISNL